VLQWQSALSDERNAIEVDVSTALLLTRNHAGQTSLEEAAKHGRKEVKKLLDLFESVLLVGLSTMKLTTRLHEFQRFLARRLYYTTQN
jgi:hypothetical protein